MVNKKGEIKITDFGISSTIETLQQRSTYVGTAVYMSVSAIPYQLAGAAEWGSIWEGFGYLVHRHANGRVPDWKASDSTKLVHRYGE